MLNYACVTTNYSTQIADDTLRKNAVVKIERYNVTNSNNKHFVLILEVSILSYPDQKIGEQS